MASDYSKYKLYRKYKTEDGVNYTPLDEYQAVHKSLYNQCDCGYRLTEYRISNPLELECGSKLGDNYTDTSQYEKWYEWEYCPNDEQYDKKTGNVRWDFHKSNSCDCGYYYIEYIPNDSVYLSYNDTDSECVYVSKYIYSRQTRDGSYTDYESDFGNDLSYSNMWSEKIRIYFTSKNNTLVIYSKINFPTNDYTKDIYLDGNSIKPKKGFNYYELSGDTTTEHTIYCDYGNTGTDSAFDMYIKGVNDKYMFYPVVETQVCEGNVVGTSNCYYLTHNINVVTELVTEPTPQRIIGRRTQSNDELITYSELMAKNEESNYPYCGYIILPNYYKTMVAYYSYCCGSNAEGTKFPAYPSYTYNDTSVSLNDMSGTVTFEESDNLTYLRYSNNGYCIAPWRIVSMELVEGAEDTMINAVWRYYYNVTDDGTKIFVKKEFVEYE